ncbi:MAG: hypothetical protein ACKV2Q_10690 [Planctomycetaceae bacterium]
MPSRTRCNRGFVRGHFVRLFVIGCVLTGNNNMFFTPDNIHLSQDGGYGLYAEKLKSLVEKLLGSQ